MEEIRDKSYNAGWAGGKAGGEAKKARKMAISLAGKGWDINQIAEVTEYDLKTIESWLKETETSVGQK